MVLGNLLKVLAVVGQEQGLSEPAVQGAEVLCFAFCFLVLGMKFQSWYRVGKLPTIELCTPS